MNQIVCVSVSPVPFLFLHHRIYGFEMLIHIHYSFYNLKGIAKGRAQINKNVKAAMKGYMAVSTVSKQHLSS